MADMKGELTKFQSKCEAELISVLNHTNLVLANRKLEGKKEIYIYGVVKNFEIWIYKDGAEIGGRDVDRRFEKDDFGTEDDLIKAFKEELESLLNQC